MGRRSPHSTCGKTIWNSSFEAAGVGPSPGPPLPCSQPTLPDPICTNGSLGQQSRWLGIPVHRPPRLFLGDPEPAVQPYLQKLAGLPPALASEPAMPVHRCKKANTQSTNFSIGATFFFLPSGYRNDSWIFSGRNSASST